MKRLSICLPVPVLCLALLSGCATRVVPFTGRVQVKGSSDKRASARAAKLYREVLADAVLCTDPVFLQRMDAVSWRLVAALEHYSAATGNGASLREFQWEFNIAVDPTANAWCLPGGKVLAFTGMFEVADTEGMLAAVLAHEMAHAVAHHSSEKDADRRMAQGFATSIRGSSQTSRNAAAAYGGIASFHFLLPHSRFQEQEADHIGLILMALAGYHPSEAAAFWRRMAGTKAGESDGGFYSTHPSSAKRMRQLDALVPTVMPIYERVERKRKRHEQETK